MYTDYTYIYKRIYTRAYIYMHTELLLYVYVGMYLFSSWYLVAFKHDFEMIWLDMCIHPDNLSYQSDSGYLHIVGYDRMCRILIQPGYLSHRHYVGYVWEVYNEWMQRKVYPPQRFVKSKWYVITSRCWLWFHVQYTCSPAISACQA